MKANSQEHDCGVKYLAWLIVILAACCRLADAGEAGRNGIAQHIRPYLENPNYW
jgi:hypothetical protein